MKGRVIALVPAYEPKIGLVGLVEELAGAGFEVVVVDDGSSVGAGEVFASVEAMATVLHHEVNRGKGEALRTGMDWIFDHCPAETMVVTVDADGQHLLNDVVEVCSMGLRCDDAGLVLGVRFDDPRTPARSRIGHDLSRIAFKVATGRYLVDTQTGLRAFRAGMIPQMMSIPGSRFEYEMNQLFILARRGVPIHQVRITTVYDQSTGSHYRGLADSVRVGRDLIRLVLSTHSEPWERAMGEPWGRFLCHSLSEQENPDFREQKFAGSMKRKHL